MHKKTGKKREKNITCIYIYIYIYIREGDIYHTKTDVYTAASLFQQSLHQMMTGFRYGFGAEASLPLNQSASAVTHDTTRLCWIDITLWDYHIHTDAVRALSWIILCISSCLIEKVQD